MVGHSELHSYFKFVYLYQMKMCIFRGLLIEIGERLFECLQFPEQMLDSPSDKPPILFPSSLEHCTLPLCTSVFLKIYRTNVC